MRRESAMERLLKLVTCVTMVSQLMLTSVAMPLKQALRDNTGRATVHQTPIVTNGHKSKSTGHHKVSVVEVPTNIRRIRLFNKNGYFLQITTRRKLRGTRSLSNPNTILEMESVGSSVIRLRGVTSNLYLCMDNNGISHALAQPTDECLFKEKLGENAFHTFASYKYSGQNPGNFTNEFYVAIKRNGKFKHGPNTSGMQKSVDFQVLSVDE